MKKSVWLCFSLLLFLIYAPDSWARPEKPVEFGIGVLTCPPDDSGKDIFYTMRCFEDLSWRGHSMKVPLYSQPSQQSSRTGYIFDAGDVVKDRQPFFFYPFIRRLSREQLPVIEIGYEVFAIIIHDVKDEWFRTGKGWLYGPDLGISEQTFFLRWSDILANEIGMHDGSMIGWFYPLTEQSLRSEPDGDEVGGFWSMDDVGQRPDLLVQKQKGDWIEVMVDTRQNVCGSNPQEPDGPVGWLRLVNDDGHPLIYWYTRGC